MLECAAEKSDPDWVRSSWKFVRRDILKSLFGERFYSNVDNCEFKHDGDHPFSSAKGNRFRNHRPDRINDRANTPPRLKWRLLLIDIPRRTFSVNPTIVQWQHYIRPDTKSSRFCHPETNRRWRNGFQSIVRASVIWYVGQTWLSNTWDIFSI